jgi:IS30 family transposase
VYVQARGVLKKKLQEWLLCPRAIRRSCHAIQKGLKLRKIKDRGVASHWDGDLIVGFKNSYIATLAERQSTSSPILSRKALIYRALTKPS